MPTDLVLLTADKNIEYAMRGLLTRPEALGIRAISSEIYVHPQRDPACARKAHEFLRQFAGDYDHALVVFDHKGCGREERTPTWLEDDVRHQLAANGWAGRAEAIVIAPELEAWVFTPSPHVEACIGWVGPVRLTDWLQDSALWPEERAKPVDPKAALEVALRKLRRPRSSAIYECLARSVGLGQCQDQAFNRLRLALQQWFPTL